MLKRFSLFRDMVAKIMASPKSNGLFLMHSKFDYMITHLSDSYIPRSGNRENLIAIWRQMEKPRRGFKTEQDRQNHLNLYQIKHYLSRQVA